jgi:hypothetical protein
MNIVERMIVVREQRSGKKLSARSRKRYMQEVFKVLEAALGAVSTHTLVSETNKLTASNNVAGIVHDLKQLHKSEVS